MNSFFKRLTLPVKLVLLGTLPLLFLVFVMVQYNREKNAKITMLDGYRYRIRQAIEINNLIEILQLERRFSFTYIMKGTSQNEMLQQRIKADEAIAGLENKDGGATDGISSYTFLNRIGSFRNRIDNKEVQPLEVMNFYTSSIFRLNTLNTVAAGNVVFLQPVIKSVTGQKVLSDIITYKGILLSQLYYLMEVKKQDPQLVASINQLQEIVATYVREFSIKAPAERISKYNALRNEANVRTAAGIEAAVMATGKIDTTINGDYYWTAATNAINKYRLIQAAMIEEGRKVADEIYNKERFQQTWSLALLVTILILVSGFIFFTIRTITERLKDLQKAAENLAAGKTGLTIRPETKDAVGSLAASILAIDKNNHLLAAAARDIGNGNFQTAVEPRSQEDILGNALVQMKDNLETNALLNQEKIWIQTGLTQLNNNLRGDRSMAELAQEAVDTLVPYLQCESGLFYSAKEEQLYFEAGYAVSNMDRVPKQLKFGETLLGQAARQNKLVVLKDVPDQFLEIRSGLGASLPGQVIVMPLCADGLVEGVIEIASLQPVSEHKMSFLKAASGDIAIKLRSVKSKQQLQLLFEQMQAQAEELHSQHAELENINAELEAQAEKLQTSEEELRVQQEELMQSNTELEERTRQLEERNALIIDRNIEIQQKADELEVSTKYKSEFLANMSHELRTPLNSILLLSRLLSENTEANLTGEQVEYAKVIQGSGQGLLSLIDEILDLSRIEAGKMELEYSTIMVQEIAADMKALFLPVARDKGISFDITIDPGVPSQVETDKLRLEQVLRNLLSNALKFTAEGGVHLSITNMPDSDAYLALTVTDTGIGIPAEKQSLIFEAFQQADGSTRRKYGGTGLGLSISRELTRLLGGEIRVESEVGKGSSFTIYLPKQKITKEEVEKKETGPDVPESPMPEKQRPVKNFRKEKIPDSLPDDRGTLATDDKFILIIEDDTAFAKALLDFAHRKGYKGLVAVRGDEGIALAQQFRPVGILLDIQLPVKDGWEVMEELKSNPETRHIPVHMMSSHESKRESLKKGAIDFISKPVAFEQMQEVFSKIEQVLSKEHKKVLIVEENPQHAKALSFFLETFGVVAQISASVTDCIDVLQNKEIDCVILDMGIPDQQAYETLETVKQIRGMENLPIIIFTGKSLSASEESRIRQYTSSIVVKTAHSYQRILDEVSIFLHLVEENKKKESSPPFKRMRALTEVLAGKKILIADDDVRNIFSLSKALELYNVQVIAATDGKEALSKLKEHSDVDAVLMDIMMPEMDGYEAMHEIRKDPQYRNLPVIAITAKAMMGDREKCINAGASDYISKPVDIDQLLSLLRVWIYDKRFQ